MEIEQVKGLTTAANVESTCADADAHSCSTTALALPAVRGSDGDVEHMQGSGQDPKDPVQIREDQSPVPSA